MSLSLNFSPSISVYWTQVIPDAAANKMRLLQKEGVLMNLPAPSYHREAPMLLVADVMSMMKKLGIKNVVLPEHWNDFDVIVPILKRIATFQVRVEVAPWVATVLGVNSANVRTRQPNIDTLSDQPRQNYWVGSFTASGWVTQDSKNVLQFTQAGEGQESAAVALNMGENPNSNMFDAITAFFFIPKATATMYVVGSNQSSLGLESVRSSRMATAEVAYMAKGVSAGDVPLSMAGGVIAERHPDMPTRRPDSFNPGPHLPFILRMVDFLFYNQLAEIVAAPQVTQQQIASIERSQLQYEEQLLQEMEVGRDTGTNMTDLPLIPELSQNTREELAVKGIPLSEDDGLEVMQTKGLSSGAKEALPETMLVTGLRIRE